MDKTEEILNWYIKCIETGTVYCRTEKYYMDNYLLQYNDAILKYRKMVFDSRFPEKKKKKKKNESAPILCIETFL